METMLSVRMTQAPAEEPVSYQELCDHLKPADAELERSDLAAKLSAAVGYCQNELCRPIITSGFEACFDSWPAKPNYFELAGNTQSVESVTYRDSSGAVTQVPLTDLRVYRLYDPASGESDAGEGRVTPAYGKSWPSVTLDTGEPISVQYRAGWADAASVPAPIKAAILLLAAHYYRNREAVTVGSTMISAPLAMAVDALLAPYKVYCQ